jgi:molybdopterin/thiamine biosynthesis adenylyltransferase
MDYKELFSRNEGVFTPAEQERLRASRVLVVGCGGVGGTVAVILARSGVGRFILVDPDGFEASNMNRQIGCTVDSLGRNKALVLAEMIGKINPEAEVETHPCLMTLEQIDAVAGSCDLVFPAADDYAFSLMVFRLARARSRPALMVVPAGMWAVATIIGPEGPTADDLHAVPPAASYDELRRVFEEKRYRLATWFYPVLGGWRRPYYASFIDENAPLAQICPTVWLASSLGALEAVKLLSGKERAVEAPWYWSITRRGVRKRSMHGLDFQRMLRLQRRIGWRIFHSPLGGLQSSLQTLWWEKWFKR